MFYNAKADCHTQMVTVPETPCHQAGLNGCWQVEYELDEGLISFGSCLERGQYAKALQRWCEVYCGAVDSVMYAIEFLQAVDLLEASLRELPSHGADPCGECLEHQELPLTPETEAMWRSLADASMDGHLPDVLKVLSSS